MTMAGRSCFYSWALLLPAKDGPCLAMETSEPQQDPCIARPTSQRWGCTEDPVSWNTVALSLPGHWLWQSLSYAVTLLLLFNVNDFISDMTKSVNDLNLFINHLVLIILIFDLSMTEFLGRPCRPMRASGAALEVVFSQPKGSNRTSRLTMDSHGWPASWLSIVYRKFQHVTFQR